MRKVIFVIVLFIVVFCAIPLIMILAGKYDWDSFFRRPPSVKLEVLHCDSDIKTEGFGDSLRLTSVIKTHNMAGRVLGVNLNFCYKDGSPVLSSIDNKPIEINRQEKIFSNDTTITELSSIKYSLFPKESYGKDVVCQVLLSYKNDKGEFIKEKQSIKYEFNVQLEDICQVTITNIQQNVRDLQDGYGISFTVYYQIVDYSHPERLCVIYFYDTEGKPLVDKNGKYCNRGGFVCTYTKFSATENVGHIDLLIPYKELHLPDKRPIDIYAIAAIFETNDSTQKEVAQTDFVHFSVK